jgi:hypothetical protein
LLPLIDRPAKVKERAEWFISGSVGGVSVAAFPDSGSSEDIISYDFVKRHKFPLDASATSKLRLPNGRSIRSIGKVTLPFKFADEPTVYNRVFTVLRGCIQDVILGKAFLEATSTFTKFMHRVKKRHVKVISRLNRLCFVGASDQRVYGSVNGHSVHLM